MDYGQVRENLNDLIKKCPFIFVKDQGPLEENDFDGEVEDFENRNLDVSQNLKKWSDLDLDEKETLIKYFADFGQEAEGEKLIVQDLVLYTMHAPYYGNELENTPSEANAVWYGTYVMGRSDSDNDEHELNVAFDKLKEMVEAQVSKDTPQNKATRALRKAVLDKDVSKVVDAINNGADPNVYITTNNKGLKITALGASVINMEPKIVKALLDANADIILKREDGSEVSALDLAKQVKEKHPDQAAKCDEIIEMLQKAEAEQTKNKINETLIQAIKEGSVEKVQAALKSGADITYKSGDKTAMQIAEELAQKDAAKHQPVLDELKKAAAEQKRQKATQDLILAIKEGSVEKAQAAVTAGADVNAVTNAETNDTVLHAAVQSGNLNLVTTLFVAGETDYALKNKAGKTALDLARDLVVANEAAPNKKAQYEAIVKALEEKAGVNQQTAEMKFPDKAPETTWEAWYAEGATHWEEKLAQEINQEIAKLPEAEREAALEKNPKIQSYKEIAERYKFLHLAEVEKNKATDKAKKKELVNGMLKEIKALNDAETSKVVNNLSEKEKGILVQASASLQEELKAYGSKSEKTAGNDVEGVNVPSTGSGVTVGGGRSGGRSGSGMGADVAPVSDGLTPAQTEKAKVALAQAKHDGSQEKSWWARNQEWIWWTLGIILAATLGILAFRKGGWLNKDKKKTSTTQANTNTNENTNTNNPDLSVDIGLGNNTNTGNTDNSGNTGNTGTGVDNTLQNSGQLYSAQAANDIIASNLSQMLKKEK